MFAQKGDTLNGCRTCANDGNTFVSKPGQAASVVTAGVVVVPPGCVETVALETGNAGNARELGPVGRAGRLGVVLSKLIGAFPSGKIHLGEVKFDLKADFDGLYRGAYEVEIVYDYNRNFKKFVKYDEAIEAVEKEKQILKQTEKDGEDLKEFETELDEIED